MQRGIGIVILLAGLTGLPSSASAFSLFGMNFFGGPEDAAPVNPDPQPYTAEIVVTGGGDETQPAVEQASNVWKDRDSPAFGMAGLLAKARADYGHIVSGLYETGRFGATVSIKINGKEAGTLPADSTIAANPHVLIAVKAGPLFHFGQVGIVNETGTPDPNTEFVQGAIARPASIRAAAARSIEAWRQQGYAKAELADQKIVADHDTGLVDVTLTIAPGAMARIGMISVDGAKTVDPHFLIAQTGLTEGAIYDPDDLDRARAQLVDLDLFQVVKLDESAPIGPDGTLPLTIIVKEKPPRRVGAGATYSTTDGLGVETFWLHRNLFGHAERLRLDARLAGISFPVNSAAFDYYFGGTFTRPGILDPDTDLVAELIAQRSVLTRYTETSAEAKLGLSHAYTPELTATYGVNGKAANFFDTTYGSRDFGLTGLYGGLEYDSRDDPSDATEGIFAALDAEPYYEWIYNNPSLLVTGEARSYFSFDAANRFTLAGRLKLGALLGPSIAQAPPDKLFFAGGGGSVRGFPFRSIGVVQPSGAVTGGTLLSEASLEARVRVTGTIGIVGFVDAGYVSDMSFVSFTKGTQFGAGVGLRYYTGFGPIRLDVAVPLNPRPGDPAYALYAGIGQAF